MKKFIFLFILSVFGFTFLNAQTSDPWKSEQLIKPAELAGKLNSSDQVKPLIFNVGPMSNIKGAVKIGAASESAGLAKLKSELANVSKDREIVVYCGCCTSQNCPNIRPAFELLKELGFKKIKCLEIEHGFQEDWAGKDYPTE
jgi:thiosulfate/3-mercaptopyruvate sulfurtransferase